MQDYHIIKKAIGDLMKEKIYLVMSIHGVQKMTKNPPSINPNERIFTINVDITNKLFKIPEFSGKLEIKESDVNTIDNLEFELKLLKDWREKQK